MIWRVMSRFAELAGGPCGLPPSAAYALFDGLFQQGLLRHLSGDKQAVAAMQDNVRRSIDQLFMGARRVAASVPARRSKARVSATSAR